MTSLLKARLVLALLILGAAGLTAPKTSANAPTYTTIDVPQASSTTPNGINDRGAIVGSYLDAPGVQHGFLLYNGTCYTIDIPGATATSPQGINNRGEIVGYYFINSFDQFGGSVTTFHGFLLNSQGLTILDVLSGAPGTTQAFGINDKGQVVGSYSDLGYTQHGFLWSGGVYTTIDDPQSVFGTVAVGINNTGQIVGNYSDASYTQHGFLFSGSAYTTIDGSATSYATYLNGINNRGQISGYDSDTGDNSFIFYRNAFTTIADPKDTPGGFSTYAEGINSSGQVVGVYGDTNGTHGFLYSPHN